MSMPNVTDHLWDISTGKLTSLRPSDIKLPTLRAPLNLAQNTPNCCSCAVLTQIRWIYGLSSATDGQEIEQLIGHEPHEGLYYQDILSRLLQDGLDVVHFEPYNYVAGTYETFCGFFEGSWTAEQKAYQTRQRYDTAIVGDRRRAAALAPYIHTAGPRYRRRDLTPELSDLKQLLSDGHTVIAPLDGGLIGPHCTLILGRVNANDYLVYWPTTSERSLRTLLIFSEGMLRDHWLSDRPTMAIRHR